MYVNCRVGSLEIQSLDDVIIHLVNCRVGSLEISPIFIGFTFLLTAV